MQMGEGCINSSLEASPPNASLMGLDLAGLSVTGACWSGCSLAGHLPGNNNSAKTFLVHWIKGFFFFCISFKKYLTILTLLILIFWPWHTARGILVSQPGIKPTPLAVEGQNLNPWTTREVPELRFYLEASVVGPGATLSSNACTDVGSYSFGKEERANFIFLISWGKKPGSRVVDRRQHAKAALATRAYICPSQE